MSDLTTIIFSEHQAQKCRYCGGHGYIYTPFGVVNGKVVDDREEPCVCQTSFPDEMDYDD